MTELYWQRYDETLGRIRAERPNTFYGVKLIVDVFSSRSSGEAFFPGGADDTLALALMDAGWTVDFEEGDYLYTATNPVSGAVLHHVEGDLYCLLEGRTPEQPGRPDALRRKKGRRR